MFNFVVENVEVYVDLVTVDFVGCMVCVCVVMYGIVMSYRFLTAENSFIYIY